MDTLSTKANLVIAIDGPAGSGKSTIAKLLAKRMNIQYIDSGAIYRSLTLHRIKKSHQKSEQDLETLAISFEKNPERLKILYKDHTQVMLLDGDDISEEIRTPEVTRQIKFIANHPRCRDFVNQKIRKIAHNYSVVIDGRDIGTVVFPETDYKFYLDANPETRAQRRAQDLNIPVEGDSFQALLAEIIERDQSDMARKIAPLQRHPEAILVDTSHLSVNEVLKELEYHVQKISVS